MVRSSSALARVPCGLPSTGWRDAVPGMGTSY
jgi:hypothetical protein